MLIRQERVFLIRILTRTDRSEILYQFVYLLKMIAALFITNSHFDRLYPTEALSVGGSLGNTLFFLISGFCLSSKIKSSFLKWMKSRLTRLYPALWLVNTFCILEGAIRPKDIGDLILSYLFPIKTYWFIAIIIAFYIIFFYIAKYNPNPKLVSTIIISIYFVLYFTTRDLTQWSIEGSDYFKYIYYLGVMYLGYFIKCILACSKGRVFDSINNSFAAAMTIVLLVSYVVVKGLLVLYPYLYHFQFVVQLITMAFGAFFFITGWKNEQCISQMKLVSAFKIVGNSTLEIYLVNSIIANAFIQIDFPINVLGAMVVTILAGSVIHYGQALMCKYIKNRYIGLKNKTGKTPHSQERQYK